MQERVFRVNERAREIEYERERVGECVCACVGQMQGWRVLSWPEADRAGRDKVYAKCRMLNVEELSLHRNHPYSCNGKGTYSEIKVWHLRTLNKLLAFNKHIGVGAGSVPPLHYTIRM